jgi:hypothetical protein
MSACGPDDEIEIDHEAPTINLKQYSLSLEVGDQLVPSSLVISITDDQDKNPHITATLDGQTISYTDAYVFSKAGDFPCISKQVINQAIALADRLHSM